MGCIGLAWLGLARLGLARLGLYFCEAGRLLVSLSFEFGVCLHCEFEFEFEFEFGGQVDIRRRLYM